jgi:hypothetical protein
MIRRGQVRNLGDRDVQTKAALVTSLFQAAAA